MNKQKVILNLLLTISSLFFPLMLYTQKKSNQNKIDPKTYITTQIIPFEYSPIDSNVNELLNIDKSIGNSRVVILAEPDHTELETTKSQIGIIKYLVEQKNFDLIIFESDFWALESINQNPKKGKVTHYKNNVYNFLSGSCSVMEEFWRFVSSYESKRPIHITGFDVKHHGEKSKNEYVITLKNKLNKFNINYLKDQRANYFFNLLDSLIVELDYTIEKSNSYHQIKKEIPFVLNSIQTIKTEILANPIASADFHFMIHELDNLYSDIVVKTSLPNGKRNVRKALRARNRQNAKNLLYLLNERYPNKKAIIWGTSYHFSRKVDGQKYSKYTEGGFLEKELHKEDMYVLAFTCGGGEITTQANKKILISPTSKEGLETWASTVIDYPYGFIDFRNLSKRYKIKNTGQKFRMKVGSLFFNMKGNWFEVFDGVFYIQDCSTCDDNSSWR